MSKENLSGAQKSQLRSLGQTIDATLSVGKEGLTAPVFAELERQFKARHLVKVRFNAEREERAELTQRIEEKTGAHEVGSVGKTALFFRGDIQKFLKDDDA